ncbi:hypothetical protein [Undibacterium pigrum]|uniref:Alpha/beta hydrolase n=1 Tax=Undibacterium pigrum TaxID=401470 RepID=A0A318IRL6_9BURK|nr:hypothetical protein [Undibacterium pigrum]PXX37804.1 hypothetical protein DFR42_11554 [Undibacterium pigrum]
MKKITDASQKLLAICVLSSLCGMTHAATAPTWQRLHLPQPEQAAGYDFPVYANHVLSGDLRQIREVIMVQHGIQRNGDDYYAAAMALLQASGRSADEMLVLAPNFPGKPDVDKGFERMPVWSVQGWTGGEAALPGTGTQAGLSSLQVLDDIAQFLADKSRLPLLKKITFAGHSGGGQLMHRYAVLNHVDEGLRARGLDVQYVVANPSSYLYFTPDRPRGTGNFAAYENTVCPTYDDYRYGMQDMVAYAKGMKGMDLYQRHLQRQVTYLVGSLDTDPNHRVLDKSCAAEAQGATRFERAHAYWAYEQYLGKQSQAGKVSEKASGKAMHHYFDVQGVGHDQSNMFGSQCGVRLLFGDKAAVGKQAAQCIQQ